MRKAITTILLLTMLIPSVSLATEREVKERDNRDTATEQNLIDENAEIKEDAEESSDRIEGIEKENIYTWNNVDYISVKIGKAYAPMERVKLESSSGFKLYEKDSGDAISPIMDKVIYISIGIGRYNQIDIYSERDQYILMIPADGESLLGTAQSGETIRVNGKSYRDFITFNMGKDGLNTINYIDIEKYLYGVVPREIPALSKPEALKAQAVAARSYAYKSLGKHRLDGYDLCDTTHCQVYGGYDGEHSNTNAAIDATKALVAVYNGKIADTFFHSSSGGHTESSRDIWGGNVAYLTGVPDPYSLNVPNSHWEIEISPQRLTQVLKSNSIDIGKIEDIKILEKTESGRVTTMMLIGENGSENIQGSKFRSMIGYSDVKSTLFDIAIDKEEATIELDGLEKSEIGAEIGIYENKYNLEDNIIYVYDGSRIAKVTIDEGPMSTIYSHGIDRESENLSITGREGTREVRRREKVETVKGITVTGGGYGHGVGMSQYGAIEMAKQGFGFEEILKHYYTGVDIQHKRYQ